MNRLSLHAARAALALLAAACTFQEVPPAAGTTNSLKVSTEYFGLRTAKYTAGDLAAAKAWYSDVFGVVPYFDEPFYVGFNIGGFELGIVPDSNARHDRGESGVAYWGVADASQSYARLIQKGATEFEPLQDVGGGVRIGAVRDPFGNILGVVENPAFRYVAPGTPGPGR